MGIQYKAQLTELEFMQSKLEGLFSNGKLSIHQSAWKVHVLENIVYDPDLWTHDLKNAISVMWTWYWVTAVSFIKISPCVPQDVTKCPKVLFWQCVLSLWPWPLTFWTRNLIRSSCFQNCTEVVNLVKFPHTRANNFLVYDHTYTERMETENGIPPAPF